MDNNVWPKGRGGNNEGTLDDSERDKT